MIPGVSTHACHVFMPGFCCFVWGLRLPRARYFMDYRLKQMQAKLAAASEEIEAQMADLSDDDDGLFSNALDDDGGDGDDDDEQAALIPV